MPRSQQPPLLHFIFKECKRRLDFKKSHQFMSNLTRATAQPACATFYHYRTPEPHHYALRCPKVFRKQQDNFIKIGIVPKIQMLNSECITKPADETLWFISRVVGRWEQSRDEPSTLHREDVTRWVMIKGEDSQRATNANDGN